MGKEKVTQIMYTCINKQKKWYLLKLFQELGGWDEREQ
jgi:hypothetical protein